MYVKPLYCDSCGGDIMHGEPFYLFEGERFCAGCYEDEMEKDVLFERAGGKICYHEEDYQ